MLLFEFEQQQKVRFCLGAESVQSLGECGEDQASISGSLASESGFFPASTVAKSEFSRKHPDFLVAAF